VSATKTEVAEVKAARDDWDRRLTAAGHAMCWQLGANARRRGHAYFWDGYCAHCGAEISVGVCWTTAGVRDARRVACSGPGTAVCTEIEAARVSEQIVAAVEVFLWETR